MDSGVGHTKKETMKQVDITPCYFVPFPLLPHGFQYPLTYVRFVESGVPQLEPWVFLMRFQVEEPHSLPNGLRERYPKRKLVPFSTRIDNDDVACFDALEKLNDRTVLIIHDFASPGWELRGEFPDFNEWLAMAKSESLEYYKDQWDSMSKEERLKSLDDYRADTESK